MGRWQPSPAYTASAALHVAAAAGVAVAPALWPWALAAIIADHALLTVAGLLPRSTLLGPNVRRLPDDAAARGEVALTIDDGPEPTVTPQVLDLLDAAGARASFFVVGAEAKRHPALLREIVARGHAVENHSMHHLRRFAALGPGRMRAEIVDAQHCLADLTGRAPTFFRPTAGLRSPLLEPILAALDLHLASWTRRAYDTRRGDAAVVHDALARNLAGGDVLLLHDGNAARTTDGRPVILAALPKLLDTLAQRQLRSVTLASVIPPRS
ncbi:polysaccharide deacetylase family protein [Azospira restricta]|uniref:Polysaccharide deacetylase family protein n=1 Tax=Azospira restricta TaxID=404405 RepID=A0A974SQV2_9RHOO|nr:polysaccharide deacetylase family protein [Azospira restricta]QRJ64749.1 polysaccharide deacetylase family protein [Azospira restricta]